MIRRPCESESTVVAIVQARMGSSRLPGKSLLDVAGKPLISHVLSRILEAKTLSRVVVAIPTTAENDILESFIQANFPIKVHRGPELDVLARFAEVARAYQSNVVVRLTADDPLKDPEVIDEAVLRFLNEDRLDYLSNSLVPSYPEGLDVEVMTTDVLLTADTEATSREDREHVTPYIWKRPSRFRVKTFESPEDLGDWRWTLDTQEDLNFLNALLDLLPAGRNHYGYLKVVQVLRENRELLDRMPRLMRSVESVAARRSEPNE
jgi:spore coat polysaccharide biosynthesis protein SpsF